MRRRNFLQLVPGLTLTPFVVNGMPLRPFANRKLAQILSTCDEVNERVLILIQLKGGNDGVNTLIPIPQYDTYAQLRPVLRVPDKGPEKYINLDAGLASADQVGLHPVLTAFKAMYDQGRAAFVQGVGYENINGSHFKGSDLWLSGGDMTPDKFNLRSGWMGRALQAMYPAVKGEPTSNMPDPLGIQLGDPYPSLGFHTETDHINAITLAGQDPEGFYSLVQTIGGQPVKDVPDSDYGDELEYIMGVERSVDAYSERISATFKAGSNALSAYPASGLANQLKTIARLLKGGCRTRIFLCAMGGFDTHGSQIPPEGTITKGGHAELLRRLAEAVKYFLDDLEGLGLSDRVALCTFSEFGRCAKENGAAGTDHGTLAPMMLFGKGIKPGVLGTNVNLSKLTDDFQLQNLQFDYRQVFTTLLQDWLGASDYVLEQTMFAGYNKLTLVDAGFVASPDCYTGTTGIFDPTETGRRALQVFPNPASINAEIRFQSPTAFTGFLTVHSLGGALVHAVQVQLQPGTNTYFLNVRQLLPGPYFIRLENPATGAAEVVKISVVR